MPVLKKIVYPFLYIWLYCSGYALSAQMPPSRQYQIKAAFLYNFTQFIEWPASAFLTEKAPIIIGVLGKDPFGSYLDEIVAGEQVNAHPLVVERFNSIEEVKTCHVLFIHMEDKDKLTQVVNALKGRSILMVSDENGFMQKGGMIRFITRNKKIRFQINPEVAKAVGLNISSKLLNLAEIVTR